MLVFANNAKTTFTQAAPEYAGPGSTFTVDLKSPEHETFGYVAPGTSMLVTVTDEATAPGGYEVLELMEINGTTATFKRLGGSTPNGVVWGVGSSVSARIPAEVLRLFPQAREASKRVHALDLWNVDGSSHVFALQRAIALPVGPAYGADSHGQPSSYAIGAELVYRTRCLDIGEAQTYSGSKSYYHGDVVVPPTANGRQYQFMALREDLNGGAGGAIAFWPNDDDNVMALSRWNPEQQAGWWVPTPIGSPTTLSVTLPAGLIVSEMGFALTNASEVPATPAGISLGTAANPTLYANAAPVSGSHRLAVLPAGPAITGPLRVTVNTQAAGASLVGAFYFKGVMPFFQGS